MGAEYTLILIRHSKQAWQKHFGRNLILFLCCSYFLMFGAICAFVWYGWKAWHQQQSYEVTITELITERDKLEDRLKQSQFAQGSGNWDGFIGRAVSIAEANLNAANNASTANNGQGTQTSGSNPAVVGANTPQVVFPEEFSDGRSEIENITVFFVENNKFHMFFDLKKEGPNPIRGKVVVSICDVNGKLYKVPVSANATSFSISFRKPVTIPVTVFPENLVKADVRYIVIEVLIGQDVAQRYLVDAYSVASD